MANLARIRGNRFLVIGRAGMDLYADPVGERIESADRFVAHLGGSSANIAAAIVKHGGRASLLTCVSDDAVGRFCLEQLAQFGVDRSLIRKVAGEMRTSLAVAESTAEDNQCVIYRNDAADFAMNEDDVNAVDFSAFDAIVATGTAFAAEPSRSAALLAFSKAREAGLLSVFDIDHRPYSWPTSKEAEAMYSLVGSLSDIVVGNDHEFGVMAGETTGGLSRARELAGSRAQVVVYKMGERGSLTITRDEEFRTGVFRVQALKPIGAGDGFMGGFLTALAAGHSLQDSVLRGSASAAIVVLRVGCAPAMPDRLDVERFLDDHPGPSQPVDPGQ